MSDLRKAAEMALDALDIYREHDAENIGLADAAYEALRQALAQPEQEPVAWLDSDGFPWSKEGIECRTTKDIYTPLYTAPLKREWVGLTNDDVHDAFNYVEMVKLLDFDRDRPEWCEAFARACEATLRHRNGEKQ